MNKRKISFVYRLFLTASLLEGIILTLKNTTSIKYLLSYYTTQSNILCFIVFVVFLIGDIGKYNYREAKWYPILKGAITIAILVTAIIYLGVLLPNDLVMYTISYQGMLGKRMGNLLVHAISPAMVVCDYAFDEKGKFTYWNPLMWLFFPIAYVIFVYSGKGKFYSIGGSREFAYFFLDYKQIGMRNVVLCIIVIAIGIMALGYIFVFLDRKLAKKQKKIRKCRDSEV